MQNIASEAKTRQESANKRSVYAIHEDCETIFNAVFANAVILQRFLSVSGDWRTIFRFNGEHAEIVNYEDYH